MILNHTPDDLFTGENFIIHFKSAKYQSPELVMPLCVCFAISGPAEYKTESSEYMLSNNYLIINSGQKCSWKISSSHKIESLTVCFENNFVNEVLNNLVIPEDRLFHSFRTKNTQPLQFMEKLYPIDNYVMPVVMKMRIASNVLFEDKEWWEEQFYELLTKMLVVHRNIYKDVEKLPSAKLSTKTELYKKIWKAKEFIDVSFKEELSLKKIAEEACISRFHFLRLFKEIFNETPHQYVSRKRIENATNLLSSTDMPVTQICNEVGFDSLSSFSWLFKQRLGFSPEAFRILFKSQMRKLAISKK